VVKDGVPVVQATGRTRPMPDLQPTPDSSSGDGAGVEPENLHD
jgi:hypothetical protein